MCYIGVDLGGTTIKVGIVSEDGIILNTLTAPTIADNPDKILKDISDLSLALLSKQNIALSKIKSIGVGSTGLIDSKTKTVITCNNIMFDNTNFELELQKYIKSNTPIFLENDANCAIVAEFFTGSMKGHKDAIMLTIGTGVGGGVIINNKLLKGTFLGETELGHMILDPNGDKCTCGQVGCLETFCSATAIIKHAKTLILGNNLENNLSKVSYNSKILELANNNINNINGANIFDAYDLGDEIAIQVINRFNNYMSYGIINLINIFKPSIICIGGGASARKTKLTDPIEKLVQAQVYCTGDSSIHKVVPAILGNNAGIIGASMLGKINN